MWGIVLDGCLDLVCNGYGLRHPGMHRCSSVITRYVLNLQRTVEKRGRIGKKCRVTPSRGSYTRVKAKKMLTDVED